MKFFIDTSVCKLSIGCLSEQIQKKLHVLIGFILGRTNSSDLEECCHLVDEKIGKLAQQPILIYERDSRSSIKTAMHVGAAIAQSSSSFKTD